MKKITELLRELGGRADEVEATRSTLRGQQRELENFVAENASELIRRGVVTVRVSRRRLAMQAEFEENREKDSPFPA